MGATVKRCPARGRAGTVWSSGAPILIVAVARPELLETRPEWREHTALALAPLRKGEAHELVSGLAAGSPVPAAARDRIVEVAEGNPLFVEQLLAYVAEDGELETVPPSL